MAKKATKANIDSDQQTQGMTAQERFDAYVPDIKDARAEFERKKAVADAANSVYRNRLKRYKKAGGDVEALIEGFRLQKLEPDEASRYLANVNWTLVALGVPVGHQLGLFPSGETVASRVDTAKIKEQGNGKTNGAANGNGHAKVVTTKATIAAAKALGKKDAAAGKVGQSPYELNSPEDLAWTAAWKAETAVRVGKTLGRGKGPARRPRAHA